MTSTLSSESENSLRRETALRLENILRTGSGISKYLPQYEIKLGREGGRKLTFVALDNRKKGKKRIYTTRGAVPSPEDLFICYMSRKDVKRLDRRLGRADRALLQRIKRIDIFADKWVLTKGKPVRDIKMFCELWSRCYAVEAHSSKSNRPPEGTNVDTYAVNADHLLDFSGVTPKIVCRLIRLHKGDSHGKSHLGMH